MMPESDPLQTLEADDRTKGVNKRSRSIILCVATAAGAVIPDAMSNTLLAPSGSADDAGVMARQMKVKPMDGSGQLFRAALP